MLKAVGPFEMIQESVNEQVAEPTDSPNPAIASRFQIGHSRRGVGDPYRSGNLNREWTPMDANKLAADFISERALSDDDLSPVDWPRQPVIYSRAFAWIRGWQSSGLHQARIPEPGAPENPAIASWLAGRASLARGL